jgi:hypothetical protein
MTPRVMIIGALVVAVCLSSMMACSNAARAGDVADDILRGSNRRILGDGRPKKDKFTGEFCPDECDKFCARKFVRKGKLNDCKKDNPSCECKQHIWFQDAPSCSSGGSFYEYEVGKTFKCDYGPGKEHHEKACCCAIELKC